MKMIMNALTECTKEVLWLKDMLNQLLKINETMIIYQDNLQTIKQAINGCSNTKSKQMDIQNHFVTERINKKYIKLEHCPSEKMIADIFTKALPQEKFLQLRKMLNVKNHEK